MNLLEYNDIQGFIPASELSRRRIRSIPKLVQVGKVEPSMVTRVDKVKGGEPNGATYRQATSISASVV